MGLKIPQDSRNYTLFFYKLPPHCSICTVRHTTHKMRCGGTPTCDSCSYVRGIVGCVGGVGGWVWGCVECVWVGCGGVLVCVWVCVGVGWGVCCFVLLSLFAWFCLLLFLFCLFALFLFCFLFVCFLFVLLLLLF